MKPRTGPRIVRRLFHYPCTNRIEFHMTGSSQQMALIQNTRSQATLKKVAAHTIGKVFHACIASMRLANRSREYRRIFRNHDQMSVIRHQLPSENIDAEAVQLFVFGHKIEVGSSITIGLENRNGSHAPLRDVMRITRRYNPGNSRHA